MRTPSLLAVAGLLVAVSLTSPSAGVDAAAANPSAHAALQRRTPAAPARGRLRLVFRAPAGLLVRVGVFGRKDVIVDLRGGEKQVVRRRLPPGGYVVRVERTSGPTRVAGAGTVYRPLITHQRFRVTRDQRRRVTVRVRMRALRGGFDLHTLPSSPGEVELAWRLPQQSRASVCRSDSPVDLTLSACPYWVWCLAATRHVIDRRATPGLRRYYALFLQAGIGGSARVGVLAAQSPALARSRHPRHQVAGAAGLATGSHDNATAGDSCTVEPIG